MANSEIHDQSVRYYVDRMEDRWAIYQGSRPLIIYREREHAAARCAALIAARRVPERPQRVPRIQILHFEAKELHPFPGGAEMRGAVPAS